MYVQDRCECARNRVAGEGGIRGRIGKLLLPSAREKLENENNEENKIK